ncbi:MAG: hypothetical protein ACXW6K_09135 [Candidatus Binatia bacterium]
MGPLLRGIQVGEETALLQAAHDGAVDLIVHRQRPQLRFAFLQEGFDNISLSSAIQGITAEPEIEL